MYYEARIIDGWLWHRSNPDRPMEKATAEETIAYLLERVMQAEVALEQALSI